MYLFGDRELNIQHEKKWRRKLRAVATVSVILGAGGIFLSTPLLAQEEATTDIATQPPGQVKKAQRGKRLNKVVVQGSRVASAESARQTLEEVPGAVSVIDSKTVERGRTQNAEDVLALQPGIYAQATSGSAANKISIRGSGLNTFYQGYSLGIKYLYDGLPFTGPGGTQEDLLNMAAVNYTEVLYGANAFSHTALSLGGAINFVTHTGRTSPGIYARVEAGSFGYQKEQLSAGGATDDTDYYVSVLHNSREGFQDWTENSGRDFITNLGHAFNSKLSTRFTVRYREERLKNGSTLTKAQLEDDPSQSRLRSGRRKDGTALIGSTTTYTFDDDSVLELGLGYNHFPLYNGWRYSPTPQHWRSNDTNITLRYLRNDQWFGKASETTITASDTRQIFGDVKSHDQLTQKQLQYTRYTGSHDTVVAIGNEFHFTDDTALSTGISAINIERDVRIKYTTGTNTTQFPSEVDYDEWKYAPRIGLTHQLNANAQIFTNVSRSIDPPVTWYFGSTGVPYVRPVKAQEGTTAEIGFRGRSGIFDGSFTLYRSWIENELLSVVVIPATQTADALIANSNASKTIHQGIEAGLNTRLWGAGDSDNLVLRQAFTLNDFHYKDDDVFGGNELPSLPRQVYQAELLYQRASGFYASINLRVASSYYVDFGNSLAAPSYTLWGAKVGYQAPGDRWSVFLDARNLTDENYAAASNTAYNLRGADSPNFYPGDGFGIITGASYRF